MNGTVTIEQLLRAAQLLEQNSFPFCKLGQDYEARMPPAKLRSLSCIDPPVDMTSAGSSRRSSPSTTTSSTGPNSPSVPLSANITSNLLNASRASSTTSQSTRQSRAAHNELEKNRRANLRNYLDKLKSVLPPDAESTRDTTLSLLTRSRNYLRFGKQKKTKLMEARDLAMAEHIRLQEQLEMLKKQHPVPQVHHVEQIHQIQQVQPPIELQENVVKPEPLMLIKPEPQPAQSPVYMEYSPSTKPLSPLSPLCTLSALLPQLNQLSQATTAALLQNNLLYTPAIRPTPIDLINEGLLPQLPLLYPYPYLDAQRQLRAPILSNTLTYSSPSCSTI